MLARGREGVKKTSELPGESGESAHLGTLYKGSDAQA